MRNPFEKRDNTGLIVSIAIGSVVAGAAAYLFLTERGASVRAQAAEQIDKFTKRFKKDVEQAEERAIDYVKKTAKKAKTDRDALLHGDILTNEHQG
ncbi:YtxH domain-containing protein [Mucilaginibacter myungsuensis]|uniref:YtxH domain-containing protein n=1 Tax=Mucilaginibacter myungsuensis TaxID=649104 RepID=A0A929PWA3_9SPHI|nr:YtxH domain-containing protein [Mucilaginibacter myungsuensis]MBE9661924.1 YtxH domain-containing protein [Mucilaginibacter myungsuensis]MDN3599642.1 YtxH domain-containing protein [Mucilaginibacter myungsuensis]